MFKGHEATAELKAAALDPDPTNPDNIMNVLFLCFQCHALVDKTMVSLIPQILESPTSTFPYDPRSVKEYDVVVEFPAGMRRAVVSVLQDDGEVKRMRPGHVVTLRTADPAALPLPHPLLLQLHAICGRMVVLRGAAGYPVSTGDDSDGDTVYDALRVGEEGGWAGEGRWGEEKCGEEGGGGNDIGGKECFGEFGAKEISRDPAVVMLELGQRRYEQERVLEKRRARRGGGGGRSWVEV